MSGNGASNTLVGQPALDHQWYPIALSEDIDPGPHGVQVLGRRYALWRSDDGSPTAAPDRCPHRQAPLSEGRMVDGCLECPYHGWRFGAGGRCELVPSSVPGTPVPPKAHLDTVNIEERYGLVWLCPGKPLGWIPEIPQEENPEFRRLNTPFQHWAVSSTRITDNFMDFSHFPFVHTATFGLAQETVIPPLEMGDLPDGYRGYVYEVNANNTSDAGQTVTGQEDDVLHRRMTTGYVLPFSVRSTIAYESGLEHILLLLTTPMDDVNSLFNFVVWRNDDFSVPADEIMKFDLAIGAEDKAMLEKLEGVLPMDLTATVSVQSDRPSVEWRRSLAALMAEGGAG
ncbi:MAG: aromatic ring-hydroxylating dioxygenase subunit alpha [Acidimicrobiia bacterium]|nr:aromatic ring-hydroxylating dioxygenase subunit alpha [Acidimicrobiia bacterium]MYB72672.1 aromatic ring-hydroxylating dioxygenase subunit alpha [Acidimicrobiia bacterium]MYI00584.1 aromatic ring-hydroxylating dioxygenase subunit alpha [Acidimicrobiia bacterium]